MNFVSVLLIIIIFSGSRSLAWDDKFGSANQTVPANCHLENQVEVEPMPPRRSAESKDISFCHAFVAATMIDQLNCRQQPGSCRNPGEMVSMLDVALRGDYGGIEDFGSVNDDLALSLRAGRIAREQCLPFDKFKLFRSSNPQRVENFRQLAIAYYGSEKNLDQNIHQPSCSTGNIDLIKQVTDLKLENNQIIHALAEPSFQDFIAELVTSPTCEVQGKKINPALMKQITLNPYSPTAFEDLEASLTASFKNNIPASWPICLTEGASGCEAGHVMTLFGTRRLCCSTNGSNTCQLQLLARDSADVLSKGPGDYWVDEKIFRTKTSELYQTDPSIALKESFLTLTNSKPQ